MDTEYQYWQNKKTDEVYAVKLVDDAPTHYAGPLKKLEYRDRNGTLLTSRLKVIHYGFRFEDDPFNYVICDV